MDRRCDKKSIHPKSPNLFHFSVNPLLKVAERKTRAWWFFFFHGISGIHCWVVWCIFPLVAFQPCCKQWKFAWWDRCRRFGREFVVNTRDNWGRSWREVYFGSFMFINGFLSCSDFLWMTCLHLLHPIICTVQKILRNLFPSLTWVWRSTPKAAELYERHFQICIHHSLTLFAVSYRKEGSKILDSFGVSVWFFETQRNARARKWTWGRRPNKNRSNRFLILQPLLHGRLLLDRMDKFHWWTRLYIHSN